MLKLVVVAVCCCFSVFVVFVYIQCPEIVQKCWPPILFYYNLHLPNGRFVFTFFTACDFGQASWEDNAAVEFSVSETLSLARQKLKKITWDKKSELEWCFRF